MSPQREPADPPDLQGYTYLRLLGSGGFADVFLYERELPRMQVAIKVLVGTDLTIEARRRFTDEANTMARFQSHPYIVPIIGADISSDGRPYIVMQFYPNDNLAVRSRRQPLSTTDALRVGIQISSAVETAHRAGILHRDIKPANILTSEFGDPGLTDFGIAGASAGESLGQSEGLSIPWSPPEAFEAPTDLDERSDVYSLGATVFHLLTGRSPFEVPGGVNTVLMLMERIERSPVPSTSRGDVPAQLERVLAQAMSKSPDLRHASALSFARDLQGVEQALQLKTTTIVVPSELAGEPLADVDDGADQTRGRMVQKIDPYADPLATSHRVKSSNPAVSTPKWNLEPSPASSSVPDLKSLTSSSQLPHSSESSNTEDAETRSRPRKVIEIAAPDEIAQPKSRFALLVGIAVVLVAGLVLVFTVVLGGSSKNPPQPSAAKTPNTAPVDLPPATPTHVSLAISGSNVTVSWTDPKPQRGDYFDVEELIQDQQVDYQQKGNQTAEFTGVAIGQDPCFTVALVRKNSGVPSNPSPQRCVSNG